MLWTNGVWRARAAARCWLWCVRKRSSSSATCDELLDGSRSTCSPIAESVLPSGRAIYSTIASVKAYESTAVSQCVQWSKASKATVPGCRRTADRSSGCTRARMARDACECLSARASTRRPTDAITNSQTRSCLSAATVCATPSVAHRHTSNSHVHGRDLRLPVALASQSAVLVARLRVHWDLTQQCRSCAAAVVAARRPCRSNRVAERTRQGLRHGRARGPLLLSSDDYSCGCYWSVVAVECVGGCCHGCWLRHHSMRRRYGRPSRTSSSRGTRQRAALLPLARRTHRRHCCCCCHRFYLDCRAECARRQVRWTCLLAVGSWRSDCSLDRSRLVLLSRAHTEHVTCESKFDGETNRENLGALSTWWALASGLPGISGGSSESSESAS